LFLDQVMMTHRFLKPANQLELGADRICPVQSS